MQKHINIQHLNPYLICTLCSGYLIDATTLVECLHSFCRSCLIKYLENSYNCPKCSTEIHKTKPLEYIRSDSTLQELVNKLVPGLFHDEEKRRKNWEIARKENQLNSTPPDIIDDTLVDDASKDDSRILVTLKYFRGTSRIERLKAENVLLLFPTRYLCCEPEMTIHVLKKFILLKFDIDPEYFELDVWRGDETLVDELTLRDIVQIFGLYRERKPLELRFSFFPTFNQDTEPKQQDMDTAIPVLNIKTEEPPVYSSGCTSEQEKSTEPEVSVNSNLENKAVLEDGENT